MCSAGVSKGIVHVVTCTCTYTYVHVHCVHVHIYVRVHAYTKLPLTWYVMFMLWALAKSFF